MDAKVTLKKGMNFVGTADSGHEIPLDASAESGGEDLGSRPLETLAIGMAGCSAMDVISILRKKQQDVTDFEVRVHAERASEHPKVFTSVIMEYVVTGHNLELKAVARAVELSETKYCSAIAMMSKAVPIETKITLIEAD